MITGYAATLTGGTSGAISRITDIKIGGQALGVISAPTLGDTGSCSTKIPGGVTGKPMRCTVVMAKAIYNTLRLAAIGKTVQTWTVAEAGAGSWAAALSFISHVGRMRASTKDAMVFDLEITPGTKWVRTVQV